MAGGAVFNAFALSWVVVAAIAAGTEDAVRIGSRVGGAMLHLQDSLTKFASSLQSIERKGLEILDLEAANQTPAVSSLAEMNQPSGRDRRRRRKNRHGVKDRSLFGHSAAVAGHDKKGISGNQTVDDDSLYKNRNNNEGVRVIRIKIIHHEEDNDHHHGNGSATPSSTGPYANAVVAVKLTTSSTTKKMTLPKADLARNTAQYRMSTRSSTSTTTTTSKATTARRTRALPTLRTAAPKQAENTQTAIPTLQGGVFCANNNEQAKVLLEVAGITGLPASTEEDEQQEDPQHQVTNYYAVDPIDRANGKSITKRQEHEIAMQQIGVPSITSRQYRSDDITIHFDDDSSSNESGMQDPSTERTGTIRLFRFHKASSKPGQHYRMGSRDHLRIHIVHKPAGSHNDVNESFFANHTMFHNNTANDILYVKTDDHFKSRDLTKILKSRNSGPNLVSGDTPESEDAQDNSLPAPEYVREFERKVKQVNESLQRIRNYNQPSRLNKKRSRRNQDVLSSRTLRLEPRGIFASRNRSHKAQASDANPARIRIILNRKQEVQVENGGSRTVTVDSSAPELKPKLQKVRDKRTDSEVRRPKHAPTSNLSNEVEAPVAPNLGEAKPASKTVVKPPGVKDTEQHLRQGSQSQPHDQPSLLTFLGQLAEEVDRRESPQPESKYSRLRYRAITLTCVLSAVSLFTVVVVLTMLYLDVQRCLHFKKSWRYGSYRITGSLDDFLEESRPLNR